MITAYAANTPNGYKLTIFLEMSGLPYNLVEMDLSKKEQKEPKFLALNPNGKIPVCVDHDDNDKVIFESGAILIYLANKTNKFLPKDKYYEVLQWLFWQVAGLGPMQGQLHVFRNYKQEKIPAAIERYNIQTRRLYKILDEQLAKAKFVVGNELTIADIAIWPWIMARTRAGIELDEYKNLSEWFFRLEAYPGFKRGIECLAPRDTSSTPGEKAISTGRKMLDE